MVLRRPSSLLFERPNLLPRLFLPQQFHQQRRVLRRLLLQERVRENKLGVNNIAMSGINGLPGKAAIDHVERFASVAFPFVGMNTNFLKGFFQR